MMKELKPVQMNMSDIAQMKQKHVTKREIFLNQMEQMIPWRAWLSVIEPHYYHNKTGRPARGLETMLRMYLVSVWFNFSDEMAEDMIQDSASLRRFVKIDLMSERVPDATTLGDFRKLLTDNELCGRMFEQLNAILRSKGIMMQGASIVDASIVDAPSSTKNRDRARDPEMGITKKGNNYRFGLKYHTGVDAMSGLVHSVETTSASEHDITIAHKTIRKDDKTVYGDAGYIGIEKRDEMQTTEFQDKVYEINIRRSSIKKQPEDVQESLRFIERMKSQVRCIVEHPYHIIKNRFGAKKTRLRGIKKNDAKGKMLFASNNLYMCARRGHVLLGY